MAGGTVYGASNFTALLHNHQRIPCSSEPPDALLFSGSSPSFLGGRSMLSFEDVDAGHRSERSIFRPFDLVDHRDDDLVDECFHQPEKKRRLSLDQVHFLEKSFEVENKLEPERKVQLAKKLGLQPRQVAIWFQNRRARWKTKQLERDYEVLQESYNRLKANYDSLHEEKEKLKTEVLSLTDKLLNEKDKGDPNSELSKKRNIPDSTLEDDEGSKVSNVVCKQEELCSAKSDVLDSESRHGTDADHSPLAEPGDSSNAYEPDQSDLSQDEEGDFSRSLLPTYIFPKAEDADYPYTPATNSCNFGFPVDDQHAFWPWS